MNHQNLSWTSNLDVWLGVEFASGGAVFFSQSTNSKLKTTLLDPSWDSNESTPREFKQLFLDLGVFAFSLRNFQDFLCRKNYPGLFWQTDYGVCKLSMKTPLKGFLFQQSYIVLGLVFSEEFCLIFKVVTSYGHLELLNSTCLSEIGLIDILL